MTEIQNILLEHAKNNYFHVQDAIKLIYQNEFQAEHLINNRANVVNSLKQEIENNHLNSHFFIENIGNDTVRFHLANCDEKIQTLISHFFMLHLDDKVKSNESFYQKCNELIELTEKNSNFLKDEPIKEFISDYFTNGIRAIHHSEDFRTHNIVHYRVMPRKNAVMLMICLNALEKVAKNGQCIIAIDGRCGSGKTTIADILQQSLDSDLIHMDDFFLQGYQRTPQRAKMIGGNFDYERFIEEIITPLKNQQLGSYQRFDCQEMKLKEIISLKNKPIKIIEGSYSLHPILGQYYDISVSVNIDPDLQSLRILQRNGPKKHKQFIDKWIPKENLYFDTYSIIEKAQFHI